MVYQTTDPTRLAVNTAVKTAKKKLATEQSTPAPLQSIGKPLMQQSQAPTLNTGTA